MDKDAKKILCALAYPIWIVAIINLIIAEKDKDLKYHGAQGLFFGICIGILFFALSFIAWILFFIPAIGWIVYSLLWMVLVIGSIVLAIMYAIKAFNLEKFKIPVVYDISKKAFKNI